MADYTQLKVPDLKKLLQERGLTLSGNKADLIARLSEHDKKDGGGTGKALPLATSCPLCAHTDKSIFQQLVRMKSTGMKMTRLQQHQLLLPLLLEVKDKSQIRLRFPIKKSIPIPLRLPI